MKKVTTKDGEKKEAKKEDKDSKWQKTASKIHREENRQDNKNLNQYSIHTGAADTPQSRHQGRSKKCITEYHSIGQKKNDKGDTNSSVQ